MRLLVVMITTDHDVLVRDADVDPDLVEVTLVMIMVFCLNRHTATGDVVTILLELGRLFANSGLYCIGVRNPPKRNL